MRTHGADPLVHALFAGLLVVGVVAAARVAFAAPDVIVQFEGLNDDDAATLGGAVHPPDANLAVGPDHVFEIVNFSGRISNKSGGTVTSFALDGFFGTTADEFAGDPRVLYDAISGRWFATEFAWNFSTGTATIVLAVSQTSDPTGTFCLYRLGNPTSEPFETDFPTIGMTDDKVIVSYNAFSFPTGGSYAGAGYYVLNKADLLACAAVRSTRAAPSPTMWTMQTAQALTSTSDAWATSTPQGAGSLPLVRISGVPGVSTVTATPFSIPIRTWNWPVFADQPGAPSSVDTND